MTIIRMIEKNSEKLLLLYLKTKIINIHYMYINLQVLPPDNIVGTMYNTIYTRTWL